MPASPWRPSSIRRVLTTGSSRAGPNGQMNCAGSGPSSAAHFSNRSMLPTHRPPTHPGEMLLKEFLEPLGRADLADAASQVGPVARHESAWAQAEDPTPAQDRISAAQR